MGRSPITNKTFKAKKMGSNPFLRDYSLKVMEVNNSKELNTVKRDEGIITDITATGTINNRYYVEVTPYARLYKIQAHLKELIQLPGASLKLLLWIIVKVENGNDYIVVDIADFKNRSSVSHSSYCRAVDDLTGLGFIIRHRHPNVFWINPAYFFSGNTITKYPDNIHVVAVNTEEIKSKYLNDELK